MATYVITHEVDDVEHWLSSPKREEVFGPMGITVRTFRDPDGSNRTALIAEIPDMEAFQEVMRSEAAADAMKHDGVRSGDASRVQRGLAAEREELESPDREARTTTAAPDEKPPARPADGGQLTFRLSRASAHAGFLLSDRSGDRPLAKPDPASRGCLVRRRKHRQIEGQETCPLPDDPALAEAASR